MRKLLLLFLLLTGLWACKKEDEQPKTYSDRIVLQDAKLVGDSITLTWSALDDASLVEYRVIRRESSADQGDILTPLYSTPYGKFIATRFSDGRFPYVPHVEYEVVGMLSSGKLIRSNSVAFDRPEIKPIAVQAFDVQYNSQDRALYFFDKAGIISRYSVGIGQITKSIKTAATIGYCDFGQYNGVNELYVPRNDGWVFIYQAETLEKIDQVNVGSAASCVVANNGFLYVNTGNQFNNPLRVYSRASKALISQGGEWAVTRLKRVPMSNTELVEITFNIGPTDQRYYSFSPNGTLLTQYADRYHGDYPLNAGIFEFFPDGNRYITASTGSIYSKGMTYEGSLPKGNLEFTSFAFDATGQTIYGGTTTQSIEVYTAANYSHTRSIKTKAYPFRIFQDGNRGILCVSSVSSISTYPYYSSGTPSKLVIEEFK